MATAWEMSDEDFVKIKSIRDIFDKEYHENSDLYEKEDYSRVMENDYLVWRFLDDKDGRLEDATKMLVRSMRWRKQVGVNSIKETDFPREFFRIGANHMYVKDKKGMITYYSRLCVPPVPKEFMPLMTRLCIFGLEMIDRIALSTRMKFGLIYDCRNPAVTAMDMSSLRETMSFIQGNYPSSVGYMAYYEMPVVLKAVYKMVRTFTPPKLRELVIFVNRNNIDDHIGLENVPEYMGGTCDVPYYADMDHCPSLEEVATKEGINHEAVDEFYHIYAQYLDEYQRKRDEREKAAADEINNPESVSTYL
ncbi:motile sperm domain-containing protein 2 [Tetranychus urticae]|uniref:CRAL-TRIO domain-containing protein n=1 Tax=Tetranychus urticae TaxID=32264 RepID=T1JT34_TETUR|nr:motile sperm domain-containing protein 2 [Tetranychus urticae]XP_025017988.1 motile sperm domain-containing protein 2 [Tetranychus urticae]